VYAVKNFTEWSDKRLVAEQDFSDSFIEKIKINETSDYCFGVFWKGKKEILSYSQSPSYNIFASKLHFSLSKIIILNFSDIKALQEASFMDKILASYISNEAVYYLHKAEGKSKAQRSEKEFYFSFFKKMNIKFVILDNDAEVPEYVFEYFNGERVVDAKSGTVLIKKK
jgi:hypothetical protein